MSKVDQAAATVGLNRESEEKGCRQGGRIGPVEDKGRDRLDRLGEHGRAGEVAARKQVTT